jgi:hypothetical protein
MYQGGNMWSAWPAYLTAFRDVLGLELPVHDELTAWEACAIEGGFRLMHKDFCMVSDRPKTLKVDAANRPHCDDGPSHEWRDGWKLYHWHGMRLPVDKEFIVTHPERITIAGISSEPNSELKRAMVEKFGYERYLRESGATLLDECAADHAVIGLRTAKLWRAGGITLLDLLNSTPEPDGTTKRYIIPVRANAYNGDAGRKCAAASASTWRHRSDPQRLAFADWRDYAPEFES